MKKLSWILLGALIALLIIAASYVQAANPVTFPINGGTGTSTKPNLGDVLVGQSNGTYGPQATSTLGISGGGGTNYFTNSGIYTYLNTGTNLGIGTTTPNHLLTIAGSDTSTSLTTTAVVEANLINTNTTANNSSQLAFDMFDTSGSVITGAKIAGVFTSHTAGSGSADLAFINKNAGTNQENARLTSAGNFGIGLSNPTAKLEVMGTSTSASDKSLIIWSPTPSALLSVSNDGTTAINGNTIITGNAVVTGTTGLQGATTITSTSANALAVGGTGATNPAFNIDASTASSVTGLNVKSAASGSGVALAALGGTNEPLSLDAKGTGSLNLGTVSTGGFTLGTTGGSQSSNIQVPTANVIRIKTGSNTYVTIGNSAIVLNPPPLVTASTVRLSFQGAVDTNLTAGTEALDAYFNLGQTRTHALNTTIALQRDMRISGTAHAFATAGGVITQAAAFSVDGPDSAGTNATITNSAAIYVPTSVVSASTTNSYGLQVSAATGGTNNYAASTTGRVVMQGLTTSASAQSVLLCGASATGGEVIAESVSCTASAKRFKDNIATTTFSLDGLMQLQPISFDWKKDWLNGDTDQNVTGTQYSLIADDVQKVFPQLVALTSATTTFEGKTYAPGSVQGLQDLNHWVSAIVSWLQQIVHRQDAQQAQIDQLQAQLTAQQAEIDSLKHKK